MSSSDGIGAQLSGVPSRCLPGARARDVGLPAAHGGATVGEHDDLRSRVDRIGDLGLDLGQPRAKGQAAARGQISPVDHVRGEAGQVPVLVDVNDLREIAVADDRVRQHDLPARCRARIKDVVLRSGRRRQRGDQLLSDRVQRRVGDLRELLGEVVEDQPGPIGQRRDRRVIAHRADRLGAAAGHRPEDDLALLFRIAEQPLLGRELLAVGQLAVPVRQVVQVQQAGVKPVVIRMLGGQLGLDLVILDDPAGRGVYQEHLARLQPALAHDLRRLDVEHADLARQNDQAVAGDPVPAGPQAIAVKHRPCDRPVGERDESRAVPRLHQRGVEAVERPQLPAHGSVVLPRLRDHHEHGVRQRPAAQVQ